MDESLESISVWDRGNCWTEGSRVRPESFRYPNLGYVYGPIASDADDCTTSLSNCDTPLKGFLSLCGLGDAQTAKRRQGRPLGRVYLLSEWVFCHPGVAGRLAFDSNRRSRLLERVRTPSLNSVQQSNFM